MAGIFCRWLVLALLSSIYGLFCVSCAEAGGPVAIPISETGVATATAADGFASRRSGPPVESAAAVTRVPRNPEARPPDTGGGPVQLGVPWYTEGWAEFFNGCFIDSGSWTVTVQPTHGSVSNTTISGAGGCGGATYGALLYTWTKPAAGGTTDHFEGTWRSGDGRFTFGGAWTVRLGSPHKEVAKCDCTCPCEGNPVSIATGNKTEQVTEYETVGQNKLSFVRYYNHYANGPAGRGPATFAISLGVNWRNNFDRYLRFVYDNSALSAIIAERPNGQVLSFGWNGNQWVSDADVDVTLSNPGGGAVWVLHDTDDTEESYSVVSAGEAVPASVRARNGYTQTLNYNGLQLASVLDSYGRQLSFSYQGGLLASVTTPDGTSFSYGFDASGFNGSTLDRLVSITFSDATVQRYSYQNSSLPWALTGITDENGDGFAQWSYDSAGRVTSSLHGSNTGADYTSFIYNGDDSRTVTGPGAQQELYKFATIQGAPKLVEVDRLASSNVAAATRTLTYDANGYLASETDWKGNSTTYVNDVHGQPTAMTDAGGRLTAISYHPSFRLPLQIAAPGLTTNLAYDASGNLLSKSLVDTTTGTVPYSTNGQTRTWTYTWANFLLASVQGPRTDVPQVTHVTMPPGRSPRSPMHSGRSPRSRATSRAGCR